MHDGMQFAFTQKYFCRYKSNLHQSLYYGWRAF